MKIKYVSASSFYPFKNLLKADESVPKNKKKKMKKKQNKRRKLLEQQLQNQGITVIQLLQDSVFGGRIHYIRSIQ